MCRFWTLFRAANWENNHWRRTGRRRSSVEFYMFSYVLVDCDVKTRAGGRSSMEMDEPLRYSTLFTAAKTRTALQRESVRRNRIVFDMIGLAEHETGLILFGMYFVNGALLLVYPDKRRWSQCAVNIQFSKKSKSHVTDHFFLGSQSCNITMLYWYTLLTFKVKCIHFVIRIWDKLRWIPVNVGPFQDRKEWQILDAWKFAKMLYGGIIELATLVLPAACCTDG